MNELAILHMQNSKYCFATSKNSLTLRLRVAKNEEIEKLLVVYGNKYNYRNEQISETMILSYSDRLFDYYDINIHLKDVRFVYVFKIFTTNGDVLFYSEDGLSKKFDYNLAFYNAFQLPYISEIDLHNIVPWSQNAVFYQIFVDRFFMNDNEKDKSYINLKWGDIPNPTSYAGGDLKGIISKIDYIKSLGVNTIYLTPIFQAESNHKYNVTDYMKIDKHFGTKEDLKELVNLAHSKNMKIILDAVFNHCSDNMAQFLDVIKNGNYSKYYNWFMINGDNIDSKNINYETFSDCSYMPKFNTSNLEVQEFLLKIAMHYLDEYEIDGWRLDVSDEVSHNMWKKFREKIKSKHPNCIIIGENWHDAYPFLQGDEYDSIMNYAFTKASLDFFAFNNFNAQDFSNKLNELLMRNTDIVNSMMLNLLDSHDTHRFFTEVKCSTDKLEAAIAIMYFYPGMPMIYYGTENNMEGNFDPDCRRTFDWQKSNNTNSTKEVIKFLSIIKTQGLLSSTYCKISSIDGIIAIERKINDKELITLKVNLECDAIKVDSNEILFSNKLEKNNLKKYGFIIERSKL